MRCGTLTCHCVHNCQCSSSNYDVAHFQALCVLSKCMSIRLLFRFLSSVSSSPFFLTQPHYSVVVWAKENLPRMPDAAATVAAFIFGVPLQHGSFHISPLPQCCTWCSHGLTLHIYFVEHQLGLAFGEWEVLVFASCLPVSTHRLVHNYYSCGHVLSSKYFSFRWQWTQLWLLPAVCIEKLLVCMVGVCVIKERKVGYSKQKCCFSFLCFLWHAYLHKKKIVSLIHYHS